MTLGDLKPGQSALVQDVRGDDTIAVRLLEMGVIEGTLITFLGAAPLGDPLEFELPGYRLSLRRREAERVIVAPPDTTA